MGAYYGGGRRRRSSGYGGVSSKRSHSSSVSGLLLFVIDVVAIAVILVVFAYFHHVRPMDTSKVNPVELPSAEQTQAESETPSDAPSDATGTETTEPAGTAHKFESRFTATPTETDTTYSDNNVSVEIMTFDSAGVTYHVADVYVRDVTYLKTAFTGDQYGGASQMIQDASKSVNAFVAINGDQYGMRRDGTVVRNGVLYRETTFMDVAVLENDGTLNTYLQSEFDIESVKQNGAWQVWSFGPVLLKDGQPMDEFNSSVKPANPRMAIGMVEPLHYLFVAVDGRGDSAGLTLKALSQLMFDLGCKTAYNLDGGATAAMAVNGELYSTPSGERKVTDIIYIGKQ